MLIEFAIVVGVLLANVVCYACHHKSLLRGKLKGPLLLFISNRASAHISKTPITYWALDVLDPTHLVTSHYLNDISLLLLRVSGVAFFVLTLVLEGLTGDGFGDPAGWFTFFTNWTFVLFGVNSVLGVVLTGWFIQAKINTIAVKAAAPQAEEEEQSLTAVSQGSDTTGPWTLRMKWGHLSAAYLFMTETVACSTLFLSFFYWTFLFSPKAPMEVDNILKHGVNNAVLLLDVVLSRIPFVSYHYQVVLWYGTIYTLFMWFYHAFSLHWVYDVLDWSQPSALVLYLLNPLFLFASFLFWYLVACMREWVAAQIHPQQQVTALQRVDFQ